MSDVTCRGSIYLGTACLKCVRCQQELKSIVEKAIKYDRIKKGEDMPDKTPITQHLCGWVCPVCGGGNSNLSTHCPCVPVPFPKVTC